MNDKSDQKVKREVPVLSFEEFLMKEKGEKVIHGPFKVRAEDKEKLMEYLKRR